jgi:hypothetical protein
MAGATEATTNLILVAAGQALSPVIELVDAAGNPLGADVFIEGSPANVLGEDFSPNTTVTLSFDTTSGQALGTATTDANGSFTTTVNLPGDQTGNHSIVAAETVNGTTSEASAPLFLEIPPP